MASIRRRDSKKKGPGYLIQNKTMDPMTGRYIYRSMTWRPEGMSLKDMKKEVLLVAAKFDEDCERIYMSADPAIEMENFTVTQYCEYWVERRKTDLALNTLHHYEESLKYIRQYIGAVKLKKLTPFMVQKFYDILDNLTRRIEVGTPRKMLYKVMENRGISMFKLAGMSGVSQRTLKRMKTGEDVKLSVATKIATALGFDVSELFKVFVADVPYEYESMNKVKRCFRAIMSTAKRQMLIKDNYATSQYVTFKKRPPKQIECMDDEECKIFFNTLMKYPDIKIKTALMIALLMGMRRAEVAGLSWEDINFDKKTMSVNKAYTTINGHGVVMKDPKTRTSRRKMTMPELMVNQLLEYKAWQDNEKEMLGDRWQDYEAIITNQDGKRIHPNTLDVWLHKALKDAELPKYTLHSLRHSNVTLQLMAGVPITIVATRVGHARVSTTLDIYSHFIESQDELAASKLDSIFTS